MTTHYRNQEGKASSDSVPIIIRRSIQIDKMFIWLESEIGCKGIDWIRYYNGYNEDRFYFASEEDKVKFILRWI